MFVSFVRSKNPKVVSNLVEFFYLAFFFFSVLCLNYVFLHVICGSYLFLCLGFASALTLIYISMRVWRINCLVCCCVELQKKNIQQKKILWIKIKRKQIYIEKKTCKDPKKSGVQHNLLLHFICDLLTFYLQSVFLKESPCCLL